jgi:hypothetical protein
MALAQMKAVSFAPSQMRENRTVEIRWGRPRISCQLQDWHPSLWEISAGQCDLRGGYLPL